MNERFENRVGTRRAFRSFLIHSPQNKNSVGGALSRRTRTSRFAEHTARESFPVSRRGLILDLTTARLPAVYAIGQVTPVQLQYVVAMVTVDDSVEVRACVRARGLPFSCAGASA